MKNSNEKVKNRVMTKRGLPHISTAVKFLVSKRSISAIQDATTRVHPFTAPQIPPL